MRLKPISKEGIPAALQKAERYRLLNDSSAAESICLDILSIDQENQQALVMLLLSITDQFGGGEDSGAMAMVPEPRPLPDRGSNAAHRSDSTPSASASSRSS